MKFRKNDFKNKWLEELDMLVPELREDVKKAAIPVAEKNETEIITKTPTFFNRAKEWLFSHRKRAFACGAACVAVVIALSVTLPFLFKGSSITQASAEVIALEINPGVVFSVDKKGIVTEVAATNTDADVILSDEKRVAELEGRPVAAAVKTFVDYAARLGYLDFSGREAIRMTSCLENGRLENVGGALKGYFLEKGAYIAVVTEPVSPKQFLQGLGVENVTESESVALDEVVKTVCAMPTTYAQRMAEICSLKELQTIYREEAQAYLKANLEADLRKLKENEETVNKLVDLNDRISQHDDNPHFLISNDYWSVMECTSLLCGNKHDPYTQEFSALLQEMKTALYQYKEKYGVAIESELQLWSVWGEQQVKNLQRLIEVLADFSLEAVKVNFNFLSDLLQVIGVDISHWEKLFDLPETVEEYLAETKECATALFETLLAEGRAVYEETREAILEADYDNYIADLIAEYGSLTGYWAALKK